MKTIAVTGGSGGAGQYVVRDLLDHGYVVRNLDITVDKNRLAPFRLVDLTDYGQTFAAMAGCDAVVHLAANPEPDSDFYTGSARFSNNTLSTYNVFQAAVALSMERVVWASSETVLGYPFENIVPDRVPIHDSVPPKPQNSYALSKALCEQLGRHMNAMYGMPSAALRFSNVHYTHTDHPANYAALPNCWPDPFCRKANLWGYIDARDAAQSVRLALEAEFTTAETFIISAADTAMNRPTAELMAIVFPDVPISDGMGEYETLLSIDKAQTMLGFAPQYSWRDALGYT